MALAFPGLTSAQVLQVNDFKELKEALTTPTPEQNLQLQLQLQNDITLTGQSKVAFELVHQNTVIDGQGHNLWLENSHLDKLFSVSDSLTSLTVQNFGTLTFDENHRAIGVQGGILPTQASTQSKIDWGTIVSTGPALHVDSVGISNNEAVAIGGIRYEYDATGPHYSPNGRVLIENSVLTNITSQAGLLTAIFVDCAQDFALINSSVIDNEGWGCGYAVLVGGTAQTSILNSAISQNEGTAALRISNQQIASPSYQLTVPQSQVLIEKSEFVGNNNIWTQDEERNGGAGLLTFTSVGDDTPGGATITVNETNVLGNASQGWGAGLMFDTEIPINVQIGLSHFEGNTAKEYGAALAFRSSDTLHVQITDTDFIGNHASDGDAVFATARDGYLKFTADTQDVRISDSLNNAPDDRRQVVVTGVDLDFLAKADRTLTVTGGVINVGDTAQRLMINGEGFDGTVNFYQSVENLDAHLAGGTLGLLGNETVFKTSDLTMDANARLNTQNQAIQAFDFKGIHFSADDTTLLWSADVDLANATMDTLSNVTAVTGSGKILVDHWNVLTDTSLDRVVVDASDVTQIEVMLGLSDSGKSAVYVNPTDTELNSYWNVNYLDNGEYEFIRTQAPSPQPPMPPTPPTPLAPLPGHYDAVLTQSGSLLQAQAISETVLPIVSSSHNLWSIAQASRVSVSQSGMPNYDWTHAMATIGYNTDPMPWGEDGTLALGVFGGMAMQEQKVDGVSIKSKQNTAYLGVRAQYEVGRAGLTGFVAGGYADTRLTDPGLESSRDEKGLPWVNAGLQYAATWDTIGWFDQVKVSMSADAVRVSSVDVLSGSTGLSRSKDLTAWRVWPGVEVRKNVSEHWQVGGSVAYYYQKADVDAMGSVDRIDCVNLPSWGDAQYARYGFAVQYEQAGTGVSWDLKREDGDLTGWSTRLHFFHRF